MTTKIAFPTDEHHPFVDMGALSVAMQICEDFDPDVRIAGSDGMDFYSLSKFNKDPARMKAGGLQREIDHWQRAQRGWLDATPNASVYWLEGNHEDRLRRWLWRHPEIHGLRALAIENLLEFEKYNVEMGDRDGKEKVFYNNLVIKHGSMVRKHAAYTARGELEREFYNISVLTGHTHRGGTTYATKRNSIVQGVEGFCLCDLNPSYVDSPNWQNGIVLVTVNAEMVNFEPVLFYRDASETVKAIWREKEYVAR